MTVDCLTWEDGKGPELIVDDGGDATLMCIYGLEKEKEFEKTGLLVDPKRGTESEDEYWLFKTINDCLRKDKHFFSKLTKDLRGIS